MLLFIWVYFHELQIHDSDINFVLGMMYRMDVEDISDVYIASISMVEVCKVWVFAFV
jgi:hypothetical protein